MLAESNNLLTAAGSKPGFPPVMHVHTYCNLCFIALGCRLTPDDIKDDIIIPLKFVKFQNILNLTVSTASIKCACCLIQQKKGDNYFVQKCT